MYYGIKKPVKRHLKGKKMNLRVTKKNNNFRQDSDIYSKSLTFFPLTAQEPKDFCQNINKNLFKLEQDLAYFSFAIQEIRDITSL